jgi:hypothetical protein
MLTGVVIRGYLQTIESEGLLGRVRELVPEATRAMIDRPPLVVSTVSGTVLDDLLVAVERLRGRTAPRKIARQTAGQFFGPVLKSLLQTTLTMFGSSPNALLERMGGLSSLMVKEVSFGFEETSEAHGTLSLLFPSAPPAATLTAWEGICEFLFDFCRRRGTVAAHRALDGGRRCEIDVSWGEVVDAAAALEREQQRGSDRVGGYDG